MTTTGTGILDGKNRELLEQALPDYVRGRRWFGGKARKITSIRLIEAAPMSETTYSTVIALVEVDYADGEVQRYVLPLGFASGGAGQHPHSATITTLPGLDPQDASANLAVYDATYDSTFTMGLLTAIEEERTIRRPEGAISAWHTGTLPQHDAGGDVSPSVMGAEQSNTSIKYGDKYILKLFRRLEEGESPELEFGRYLSAKGFGNSPALLGAVEYKQPASEPLTLAILQDFVPNQGDAWTYTLRSLDRFLDGAMALQGEAPPEADGDFLQLAGRDTPEQISRLAEEYLNSARLLATRTTELHLTLGEGAGDRGFAPEPFTHDYQTALFTAMSSTAESAFDLLREKVSALPPGLREEAEEVVASQDAVTSCFEPLLSRAIAAERTRVHGDYHLGQVLYTGSDFLIIDFEGEPVRSLAERRMKHSPLKDVAGMLRSFDYSAYSALFNYVSKHDIVDAGKTKLLEAWVRAWQVWVSAAFLGTYLATANGAHILPSDKQDLQIVLNVNLLEKAVYELIYELNNRPDWVRIPLSGIAQLVGQRHEIH